MNNLHNNVVLVLSDLIIFLTATDVCLVYNEKFDDLEILIIVIFNIQECLNVIRVFGLSRLVDIKN